MARLNLRAVEERVAPLGGRASYDREFIFDLLLAYGKPQGNVTRLRNGSLSVADDKTSEVAQKNVVYFKETTGDPLAVIDDLKSSPSVVRYRTRFVIVTNYSELPIDIVVPTSIEAIFDSDCDGLLDAPEKPAKVTSADRLERAFLEVVDFRRVHGRVPSSTTREIAERKLGARLDGILANDEKIAALKELDEFGLLEPPEAPASIDDLLAGDDFDLLGDESGLLDVSDLPVRRQIYDGGDVARRKKALDFDRFEPGFKQKHVELREGTSKLLPYPGLTHIVEGAFFVLNGVMLFVAEVGESEYKKTTTGENRRERLRCVFENGTESSMYRQSLAIRLSDEDGQIVRQTEMPEILTDDELSGHIYVLRSLSHDPQIAAMKDLHKIGFTRGSVEKRVKNAETSPTYLMAPVEVVASYRTYNVKASALENLLHRVFAEVRLDLTQADRKGRNYDPSEWFVAPRNVIDQAINLILSGDIVGFVYNAEAHKLVEREP